MRIVEWTGKLLPGFVVTVYVRRMSDDSVSIEYNQSLKPLEKILEEIERPGEFFVNGAMEIPMPRIEVAGVGTLSFPLPDLQIQQLIQQATRAPYGRGEETILDESVRKVWQLRAESVRIGGKSWPATFDALLRQVTAGLGCDAAAVSAELYKLLIYDQGGFFRAHRDTEKAGGMFGTLVLVLPSAHRGGELVLRHAGRNATVDLSNAEISEVKFAAFYADCEHEVRPVIEGNRVCLIYNLIQKPGAQAANQSGPLRAPDYTRQMAAAAKLLEQELTGTEAPAKVAWLLEHQYSPEGLSFAGLKATDAARVQVLLQAAERAGCSAHLGIVHIEESGAANPTGYDYNYRRRRWWNYDDQEDGESNDDFEVIEVCNWRHYISHWRDRSDATVDFGELPLARGELLPDEALDDEKPDAQRLMEATGNAGASFERSYHRAALVLWRSERYAEVLLQAGVTAVLPLLKQKIEACSTDNTPAAARTEAVSLARRLVEAWQVAPECNWRQRAHPPKRDVMLDLLAQLGDTELLAKFISDVVEGDYDGSENVALGACAHVLGAKETGILYAALVRRHTPRLHYHCVNLLCALVRDTKPSLRQPVAASRRRKPVLQQRQSEVWLKSVQQIADAIVSRLDDVDRKPADDAWQDWRYTENAPALNAALAANLLNTLDQLNAPALRDSAVKAFAARPQVFDPVTILVPALESAHHWDVMIARLWQHCAEFLLLRSGRPPEAPCDWRQEARLSCSCADCRELQAFAQDPAAHQYRFRVNKDRRHHLHRQIEEHGLDMMHVTARIGSPQTLVCTKDRRSYFRRCDEYRKDIAALGSLAKLADNANVPASLVKRINAACALAEKWRP